MVRIDLIWWEKDDVEVKFFSQWRETGTERKCLIQIRCQEMFISVI